MPIPGGTQVWERDGILYDNSGPNGAPNPIGFADSEVVDDYTETPELPPWRSRHFYTIEQLGDPQPIEWLIDGWVPAGELSMIYGPGDSYKSFLALHWGLTAAADGYRVVYIAGEGAHGLRTRIPAWLLHRQAKAAEFPGFRIDEMPVSLDSEPERDRWRAEVEDALGDMPDWVIVDTLSMNFSGDENLPADMNRLVKGLELIRRSRSSRTAMTIIHHTPVGSELRERGTAALRNATSATIRLTARSPKGFSVLVENDRQKEWDKHEPMRMTLRRIEWGQVSSLAVDEFKPAHDEVNARDSKRKKKN